MLISHRKDKSAVNRDGMHGWQMHVVHPLKYSILTFRISDKLSLWNKE